MCKALNCTYWSWIQSKEGKQGNEQDKQARGKGIAVDFYGTTQAECECYPQVRVWLVSGWPGIQAGLKDLFQVPSWNYSVTRE